MGDWYLNNEGRWTYDEDAPTPGVNPPVTYMLPTVAAVPESDGPPPDEPPIVEIYEREDGSIYSRVDAGWFDSYDEVDSRTVSDPGAPHALRGGPPDAA
jgi:hypothetical protein